MNTAKTAKLLTGSTGSTAIAQALRRSGMTEVIAPVDQSEYFNPGVAHSRLDGVTHINIAYPRAATPLGHALADFTTGRFVHPFYGPFNCMEGFGQYIKTGMVDDRFRNLKGAEANTLSKKLKTVLPEHLSEIMLEAHYHKVMQVPGLAEMMIESTLPFDHYYLFGEASLLIRPSMSEWLLPGMERMREMLRRGEAWPEFDRIKLRNSLPSAR